MKTPISYYGGKQTMLPELLKRIPIHKTYCEPFFGGGALFFAKKPAAANVINDINDNAINFYRCLKDTPEKELLIERIDKTLYSETDHRRASEIMRGHIQTDEVERAWAFFVATNLSFCNKIGGGFRFDKSGRSTKYFAHKKELITEASQRLQNVLIFNRNALEIIKFFDKKNAFIYIDPPYFNADMGHYKGYTEDDFKALLDVLTETKSKFLLSSYESDILQEYVTKNNWTCDKISKYSSAGKAEQRYSGLKTEVLTYNYTTQKTLF